MANYIGEIKRGEIYLANLPKIEGTSIQWGIRPVVAVANEMSNEHSPVVQVVPITSQQAKNRIPTHINISTKCGLKLNSTALCEQLMLVQKDIMYKKIGKLDDITMNSINGAILIQLGIISRKQLIYA